MYKWKREVHTKLFYATIIPRFPTFYCSTSLMLISATHVILNESDTSESITWSYIKSHNAHFSLGCTSSELSCHMTISRAYKIQKWHPKWSPSFKWVFTDASWDSEVVNKWRGSALLSVKDCCFVQKLFVLNSCNYELAHLKKRKKRRKNYFGCLRFSGSILSQCIIVPCWSWKHLKMNGML